MKIKYTPEAIKDLTRLREFIAVKNPLAANRIAAELVKGTQKLTSFPELGLKVDHALEPSNIRDLFIGDYTIRYLITTPAIVILRLWDDKESGRNN